MTDETTEQHELKNIQVKVDKLEQQLEWLQQENRDKAEQFEQMSREMTDVLKGVGKLASAIKVWDKALRAINLDLFNLEKKLARYIVGFDQLNCRKCGKRIGNPEIACPSCKEAKPVAPTHLS